MHPAEGTTFERFGGANEVDAVGALLAGYAIGDDTVKEAAFQAFINGDKPVGAIGRQVISRLTEQDPWIAAEFSFNLMAESQNSHFGDRDTLSGLSPDDCWDMAASSLPQGSPEATLELAKGFCVLMDQERNFIGTLAKCNRVAISAQRNGCSSEVLQLLVQQGVKTIQKEDERFVNEDRHRVQNFTDGIGGVWRKDQEAATRIQAAIDAHQPGDYIVDKIKGTYDHSSLDDYEFSELLTLTELASVAGDDEGINYLTGIFRGVLSRLDKDEIMRFVPEIIETYLALDQTYQRRVQAVLGRKLVQQGIDLSEISDLALRETANRFRDERYSYSEPNPEWHEASLPPDSQLFWPGDNVELVDTGTEVADQHIIEDLDHHVHEQPEDETQKRYETVDGPSIRAEDLSLVERGELWKFCHGEISEFTDPIAAYNYAMSTLGFQYVNKRDLSEKDRDYQEWSKEAVLEAIERGYADAFRMESSIFVPGRDIVALKFNDQRLAQVIANSTLTGLGRQPRQAVAAVA